MLIKNIKELNKLIYAGERLVCAEIGVLLENTKTKPGLEFRLESQIIRNLPKQS